MKYPCKHGVTKYCGVCEIFDRKDMSEEELTKEFERILTIDGRGRPEKAKMLLQVMREYDIDVIFEVLENISKRTGF
jgi:hypothetical protein